MMLLWRNRVSRPPFLRFVEGSSILTRVGDNFAPNNPLSTTSLPTVGRMDLCKHIQTWMMYIELTILEFHPTHLAPQAGHTEYRIMMYTVAFFRVNYCSVIILRSYLQSREGKTRKKWSSRGGFYYCTAADVTLTCHHRIRTPIYTLLYLLRIIYQSAIIRIVVKVVLPLIEWFKVILLSLSLLTKARET